MGSRLCNQLFHASYVSGAFGTEWSVKYNQQEICALKGSTVFMNGTYTLPEGLTVMESFWVIHPTSGVESTDLSKDPDYSGRVEYLTDEQKHFSLKLIDVMKKDENQYCFRIKTSVEKEKWLGYPGIMLSVTELHVETPEEVTEGETADLTCNTTCSLTDPTFIWYINGRSLTSKTMKNNQLHLQTVSSEDAGSYSCAVRGYQHLNSTAHNLRVRYSPKNVSVSISPSGEIVKGSSVNLTCSSDANPPVKNYAWFKEGGTSPVGSGQSYRPLQSGSYYCKAQNEVGAQNATAVSVIVQEIWARSATSDAAMNRSASQEVIYANASPSRPEENSKAESSPVKTSVCTAAMEVEVKEESQEDDVQYCSVQFHQSSPPNRFNSETVDNPSAIYSSVKRKA
ncbi:B-cell receptor CD22-like [Colossoma macropomum]|uniref:B-cell receptor CD22-like n=1 Tax=Colossoma macropomum TaxID=42526 RepID=UPI001863AC1B|nr:B-cell receptor CD22-like [Colossoma macropomum]